MHPRPLRSLRLFPPAALFLLFTLLPPSVSAQDDPVFVERIDVEVVNVEVFVTDRQGNPVTDLTRGDFTILEDGEPVEITNFFSVARQNRILDRLPEDRSLVESRGEERTDELPEDQRLRLVVYFDNVNLGPSTRNRLIDEMEGFLEDRVIQGDDVMIVGYDRTIDVATPFTQDPERIRRALDEMRKAAALRPMQESRKRQVSRYVANPTATAGTSGAVPGDVSTDIAAARQLVRSYVHQAEDEMRRSTEALGSVVRSLAGLPGRKALMYVSDGLALRPGETLYQQLADAYSSTLKAGVRPEGFDPILETFESDLSPLFEEVVAHANANQVTFYPIDARGPAAGSTLSAEYTDLTASNAGHVALDGLDQASMLEPLLEMAAATGGRTIFNTFAYEKALVSVDRDFDQFYSLGYRSRGGGDGKSHRIEVEVNRPGLRVRHRETYVDKPEIERVADRTLSSLMLTIEKNPLNIGLQFGEPDRQSRRKFHLPILVRIPFESITLLPSGESMEGRLRIFVAVQDEEGGLSDLFEQPYPISIPADKMSQTRGQEIGWAKTLELRPGVPKIAVGVWDELSGTESFVNVAVPVGKEPETGR